MLTLFKVFMAPEIDRELLEVLHSGFVTQGVKVEEFENKLREWFDYPYICTLNSATSGLTLALRLLNLSSEDEVLCTPLTCFASNAPVLANNLKIKWVDVDPDTCNMDLNDLKSKITEKTKAVVLVHWGGTPNDLDCIEEIKTYTKETYGHTLHIIEDCAHSFGSEYKGQKIGTHGNICVFSLQAIKHLTTGDGGLILLPTEELYRRAKLLRWYGIDRDARSKGTDFRLEDSIQEWGYKFHMNDINATIGISNLPYIADHLAHARHIADLYDRELADIPGCRVLRERVNRKSAFWLYTISIVNKRGFISYMKKNNVMVSQVHNRNDIHHCVSEYRCELPNLDVLEKSMVCIPIGWWITDENAMEIVDLVKIWCWDQLVITELSVDHFGMYSKFFGLEMSEDHFKKKLQVIRSHGSVIFVAIVDDEIVGHFRLFIEEKFKDSVGHIEDVMVLSAYRNLGIGSLLLKFAVDWFDAQNECYKLVLSCKPEKVCFYDRVGFVREGVEMVVRK
jgi:dTDP-4-amino-4,6-dideoxygalactose transaminase/predicted N-acetyltransferase YhbS